MSTRKKKTPAQHPPAPAPEPAPVPEPTPAPVPELRTDTERALWAVLDANQSATTGELAALANMSTTTARRILARWEDAGFAESARDTDTPNAAKTWIPRLPGEPAPAPAEPTPDSGHPQPGAPAPAGDETAAPDTDTPEPAPDPAAGDGESGERLPNGALRGMVEDFLRDHPGEEFSPTAIGTALGRSGGAVNNALVKLTREGTARQTQQAPKRFALAD